MHNEETVLNESANSSSSSVVQYAVIVRIVRAPRGMLMELFEHTVQFLGSTQKPI